MSARSISVSPTPDASPTWPGKIEARGKFFFCGADKVLLKGITYGPFAPDALGAQFPEWNAIARDLDLITELGANTLRTFTVPPRFVLDLAASRGVRVLVGIPWAEHVCFLDSKKVTGDIRRSVARSVKECASHPAVAAYMIGNEIPPDIVRWYGAPRVAGFLRELVGIAKENDPETLVGYANFPSTEYLETEFTDFLAFNVYLHREPDFRRYLSRLHSLAGNRPLVLTEFGIDSMREGDEQQAATLSWQVRSALEMGTAGTCVFSFTDEWFTGGHDVRDWSFGVVDRDRRRKSAFRAVKRWYASDGLPALPEYPKVSVVVCAYNAESTMAACLDSLRALRYPATEVVVVDDGSTDSTGAIADQYEGIHVIHQENKGLSAARNIGMAASTGEIVAYTDADCVVDPDWLHYLVATFLSSGLTAVGGPNLPPPEDSFVASCVAASPGGPPRCCSTTWRPSIFPGATWRSGARRSRRSKASTPSSAPPATTSTSAGACRTPACASAGVPRRWCGTSGATPSGPTCRQQRGYGNAEALLSFRHPHRFNVLGQSRWRGRIYGDVRAPVAGAAGDLRRRTWPRAVSDALRDGRRRYSLHLPFTLEWNAVALGLLASAIARGGSRWLGALPIGLSSAPCLSGCAPRARRLARGQRRRPPAHGAPDVSRTARALSGAIPDGGRAATLGGAGRGGLGRGEACRRRGGSEMVSFWTEVGLDKEAILHRRRVEVASRKYIAGWTRGGARGTSTCTAGCGRASR